MKSFSHKAAQSIHRPVTLCHGALKVSLQDYGCNSTNILAISEAYGVRGAGILTISSVPGILEKRERLLRLSHKFANLPDQIQEKYETPLTHYSFGWSHGQEYFGGMPDISKGSYYADVADGKSVCMRVCICFYVCTCVCMNVCERV